MSSRLIVAGLDLGSHCVKCVIGLQHADGQLDIIGTGSHPALGLRAVLFATWSAPFKVSARAVDEAELMAGCEIKEAFLSVSSRHLSSFNGHGMARIIDETVDVADVHSAIDLAKAVSYRLTIKFFM